MLVSRVGRFPYSIIDAVWGKTLSGSRREVLGYDGCYDSGTSVPHGYLNFPPLSSYFPAKPLAIPKLFVYLHPKRFTTDTTYDYRRTQNIHRCRTRPDERRDARERVALRQPTAPPCPSVASGLIGSRQARGRHAFCEESLCSGRLARTIRRERQNQGDRSLIFLEPKHGWLVAGTGTWV